MSYLQAEVVSHARKVLSLYKRALRNIESHSRDRAEFRYNATLLRARFDQTKDIKDLRIATQLIDEGEEELYKDLHWQPIKFAHSPGGVAYERQVIPPDWVLDYWHPMEKAAYPDYFDRREKRKLEFIEFWKKNYANVIPK